MKVCCDVTPPPPHIQDQLGGEKRWMMGARCTFTHPTTSCLVTGCLFLSLTTPPLPPVPTPPTTTTSPPPSPPPHGPSLLRRLRLSLGCFEHSLPSRSFVFFVFCSGRGPLSVVVLLHACPVFLHASSPPCRRHPKEVAAAVLVVVVVVFGQLTSSLLFASSLLCSVNPHCLVVLFELT